jgi:hypothetical protein
VTGAHDAVAFEPEDDVAVLLRAASAGETLLMRAPAGLVSVEARENVPRFFKMALRDIPAGEPIRKHGQVIGVAEGAIPRGTVVHVHNLRSLRARRAKASDKG